MEKFDVSKVSEKDQKDMLKALEGTDQLTGEQKEEIKQYFGIATPTTDTNGEVSSYSSDYCTGSSVVSGSFDSCATDCITLCNVIMKKKNTCSFYEYHECCVDSCNNFPIKYIGTFGEAYLVDSCCEISEDFPIGGVKTADMKVTFNVSIPVYKLTPSGTKIQDLCNSMVTVNLEDVFTSSEIKNCHLKYAKAWYYAYLVGNRIHYVVFGFVTTEACVMENEVNVVRCYPRNPNQPG